MIMSMKKLHPIHPKSSLTLSTALTEELPQDMYRQVVALVSEMVLMGSHIRKSQKPNSSINRKS